MRRLVVSLVALVLALPAQAGANHLHTGRPDCRTKQVAARPAEAPAGEVSVHGFGGFAIDGTPFPTVPMVTPPPRYEKPWDGQDPILFEGDVIGLFVAVNMIGVLGGGSTVIRQPGMPAVTYNGAQRFDALTFTGHMKIAKRVYECESVVESNKVIRNLYYEIWLTGLLTPQPQSPLKMYGEATAISVAAGDVASR